MSTHVIVDIERPHIAHTRVDCPEHLGVLEAVDQLGYPTDDPDVVEAALELLGLLVPGHLADRARPCPACTLVGAPLWRAAA
jgi:hypothetical protein